MSDSEVFAIVACIQLDNTVNSSLFAKLNKIESA